MGSITSSHAMLTTESASVVPPPPVREVDGQQRATAARACSTGGNPTERGPSAFGDRATSAKQPVQRAALEVARRVRYSAAVTGAVELWIVRLRRWSICPGILVTSFEPLKARRRSAR